MAQICISSMCEIGVTHESLRSYVDRNKQEAVMDEGASGADHEPAILWTTAVFNAAGPPNTSPTAIYYDDRPVYLQPKSLHTEYLQAEEPPSTDRKPEQDTWSPTWSGCVFEVVIRAHAIFPGHSGNTPPSLPPPGLRRPVLQSGYTPPPPPPPGYIHRLPHSGDTPLPPPPNFGRIHVASQPQSLDILRVSRRGISIRSPFLYLSISEIVGYYPSFYKKEPGNLLDLSSIKSSDVSTEFILAEPYGVLMHHFPQLAAFAQSSNPVDSEAENIEVLRLKRKHVRLLCEHLKPHYDSVVMPSRKLLENDPPRISFDMLWYVFKPGTDVYLQAHGLVHTCVVADIYSNYDDNEHNLAQINQTKLEYWVLDLWFLETDGTSVGRVPTTCRIYPYKGLREVAFLDVCPVSIWDAIDNGKRRESIMRRSKLLVKALQQGHLLVRYDGPVNGKRQELCWDRGRRPQARPVSYADPPPIGRVVDRCGDFADYDSILINEGGDTSEEAWAGDKAGSTTSLFPVDPRDPKNVKGMSNSNRATAGMASSRRGYSIASSTFRSQDLDDSPKRSAQIPVGSSERDLSSHQLLLLFPVSQAFALRTKQWFSIEADFCYEVFPSEESIENLVLDKVELETIRGLARRQNSKHDVWAADFIEGKGTGQIILLHGDLARNGLVSAFLRRMEYCKGLLFLTTNRVGQIDDTFISRVHIAIGYKPLSGEDRKRIWHGFFHKLVKERAGKIQVALGAKKWVLEMVAAGKAQLNGRDIRNALQTAITLAEAEAEEDPDFDPSKMAIVVDQSHFQRVLDISHKFHEYVRSIRREDEKKRAAGRYDRNDYWQGGESGQS
ncbi:MAG: hypothetical protein Q9210_004274 [Variospora velana]